MGMDTVGRNGSKFPGQKVERTSKNENEERFSGLFRRWENRVQVRGGFQATVSPPALRLPYPNPLGLHHHSTAHVPTAVWRTFTRTLGSVGIYPAFWKFMAGCADPRPNKPFAAVPCFLPLPRSWHLAHSWGA